MNDLILSSDLQKAFPTIVDGLLKAQTVFDSIRSFEDIERTFLLGAGLSANTYRSYLHVERQLGRPLLEHTSGDWLRIPLRPDSARQFLSRTLRKTLQRTLNCLQSSA